MLVLPEDSEQAKQLFLSLDKLYIKALDSFYDSQSEDFKNRIEDMKRSIRDLEKLVRKKEEQDKVNSVVSLMKSKGITSKVLEELL